MQVVQRAAQLDPPTADLRHREVLSSFHDVREGAVGRELECDVREILKAKGTVEGDDMGVAEFVVDGEFVAEAGAELLGGVGEGGSVHDFEGAGSGGESGVSVNDIGAEDSRKATGAEGGGGRGEVLAGERIFDEGRNRSDLFRRGEVSFLRWYSGVRGRRWVVCHCGRLMVNWFA